MVAELGTNTRVLVAGLGVTGSAVVAALESLPIAQRPRSIISLDGANPAATLKDPAQVDLVQVDLIVVSPGWRPDTPLLVSAAQHGVEVISEIELAWRLRVPTTATGAPAPWLGVTGTNGKTTTVSMLGEMLSADSKRAAVVGNVGTPAIIAALDPALDFVVLELSSFQLHFTYSVSLAAGAVLNLAPDHLDWHGSFANYAADKARIFAAAQIACIYNVQDEATMDMVAQADVLEGARAVGFTLGAPERGQFGLIEDVLVDRAFHLPLDTPGRHTQAAEVGTLGDLAHLSPAGHPVAPHTVANALAAAALARAAGVRTRSVRDGLRNYRPGAHRMALVGQLATLGEPISFFDDSKATNAHAAGAALESFDSSRVVWIVGGLTKGADLSELVRTQADKLRAAVVIGVDQGPVLAALAHHAPTITMSQIVPEPGEAVVARAVAAAVAAAQPGDAVLLAPACASMDQCASYGERGDQFAAAVREVLELPRD